MTTKKLALITIGIFIKTYMAVSFLALIADRSKKKREKFVHAFRKHHTSVSEG